MSPDAGISLIGPDGKVVTSSWRPNTASAEIRLNSCRRDRKATRTGEPRYGRLLPYRTLSDIGRTLAPEGVSLWLEAIDVPPRRPPQVAVINPNHFGNC